MINLNILRYEMFFLLTCDYMDVEFVDIFINSKFTSPHINNTLNKLTVLKYKSYLYYLKIK